MATGQHEESTPKWDIETTLIAFYSPIARTNVDLGRSSIVFELLG
jgi:hypothetical protein